MATINTRASQALSQLSQLKKQALIGKAFPLGNGNSVFSGMGKTFTAKGLVTGKAIAFKHKGIWRVVQG